MADMRVLNTFRGDIDGDGYQDVINVTQGTATIFDTGGDVELEYEMTLSSAQSTEDPKLITKHSYMPVISISRGSFVNARGDSVVPNAPLGNGLWTGRCNVYYDDVNNVIEDITCDIMKCEPIRAFGVTFLKGTCKYIQEESIDNLPY